ncbi:MAG: hypothetical protein K1X67_15850 [Fimbriimonadaceae bacterium]|nr:hypothetical protein [Fimbriimonadaceae bacterium]
MIVPLRRLSLREAVPKSNLTSAEERATAPDSRANKPTFFENLEAMWSQFAAIVLPKAE